jgi:hypothetical protein
MAKHFFRAVCAAAWISVSAPPVALTPDGLVGWWLSLDGEFPATFWVVAGGMIEVRSIQFGLVSPAECAKLKRCSDAPLTSAARLTIKGNELHLSESRIADRGQPLPTMRAGTWTAVLSASNRLMTLRDGNQQTMLVKVEPDRLRRLRAGLMMSGLPADKHWRCFLANATAADPAFAPLRKTKRATPAFLNDYLRVASYRSSLATMGAQPTADDVEAERRALVGVETLMLERFKDIEPPRTAADVRRYRAQVAFIDQRSRGVSPQEANVVATALNGGSPVTVAATGAEFSALMRVAMRSAEAKQLFCAE